MSLRDRILSVREVESEERFIPEWGKVQIRAMTGRERERFEAGVPEAKEAGTVRAFVAYLCCYDPDTGERVFREEDVEGLADGPVAPLAKVFDAAMRLSAVSKEDVDAIEGE